MTPVWTMLTEKVWVASWVLGGLAPFSATAREPVECLCLRQEDKHNISCLIKLLLSLKPGSLWDQPRVLFFVVMKKKKKSAC